MFRTRPVFVFVGVSVLVFLSGCSTDTVNVATNVIRKETLNSAVVRTNDSFVVAEKLPEFTIGESVSHGNLTVFPIVSTHPRMDDRYKTLDEGIASGKVEVREGDNGDASIEGTSDNVLFGLGNADDDPFAEPKSSMENTIEQTPGDSGASSRFLADDTTQESTQDKSKTENRDSQVAEADFEPLIELIRRTISPNDWEATSDEDATETDGAETAGTGEQSHDQRVNRLYVRNDEEKPLYLMPGEIVLGGDQDRMIAEECIVPPGAQAFPIKVFCVEEGRWQTRDHDRTIVELTAASKSAFANSVSQGNETATDGKLDDEFISNLSMIVCQTQNIQQGKFVGGIGVVTNSVRKAAQISRDQEEVWSKVESENRSSSVQSSSKSFTANFCQTDNLKRLEPYFESLVSTISDTDQIVGVVIAVNGNIESMDVFNSTPLFRKLWPKLLKGFALQAANTADEEIAHKISVDEARAFWLATASAQVTETDENGSAVIERSETDSVVCFTSRSKRLSDTAAAQFGSGIEESTQGLSGGGGFGSAVHRSAFPIKN